MNYYLNHDQFYKLAYKAESFLSDRGLGKTFPHLDITLFLKSKYDFTYVPTSEILNPTKMYGYIEFNSTKDLTLFLLSI